MADKMFDPEIERGTIVQSPTAEQRRSPAMPLVFNIATAADEFEPHGGSIKLRDFQLRNFFPTEPILASAIYGMSARVAVLEWEIVNKDRTKPSRTYTIDAATQLLRNADRGNGWQAFSVKVLTDLYSQDNGAFIEVIRREDSPTSPVIGIAHLDSANCYRTGDPEYPVIYRDDMGRYHKMAWYQVIPLADMPSPVETMYGAQLCAVSRCLRAAQIIRDVALYKKEKLSGINPRAIHLVSGVSSSELDDARVWAENQMLNQSLYRFMIPYVVPTINPEATLSHVQIDLASLPDGYDEEQTMRWYVTQVAMAFGTDYQEFAPLATGNIGSSQQSEILHMKARGKGPAAMINLFEHLINDFGIIPNSVEFRFKEADARADTARADARFTRGKDRAMRVRSGELTPRAAVMLAILDGDLPDYLGESLLEQLPDTIMTTNPQAGSEFGVEQIEGGMETHMPSTDAKDDGLQRFELLYQLQRRGEVRLPDNIVEITEQDIEEHKSRLSDLLRN